MPHIQLLDSSKAQQIIKRMAYEIYENNFSEKELLIVGIDGNGYKVANHICEKLKKYLL